MRKEDQELQNILAIHREGISLDGILLKLKKEITNENRLLLSSKLQRNKQFIKTYQVTTKNICTIYKLKEFNS